MHSEKEKMELAWDALEAMDDDELIEHINDLAEETSFMNWVVVVGVDGVVRGDSSLNQVRDTDVLLSKEPADFLYQLGFEENEGEYVYDAETHGEMSAFNIRYHVQNVYLLT